MDRKHQFFAHAMKANLTGEQCRVLFYLLSYEYDGVIGIKQNVIAEELAMPESNVSRSIKALKDAGLIAKTTGKGFDGRPIFHIDKAFCLPPVDSKALT